MTSKLATKGKLGIFALLCYINIGTAYACKVPKSDYKNVSCTSQSGVYLAIKDDGSPVALLNNKGKKTADLFRYQAVLGGYFKDGLLPVQSAGKIGYINKNGKIIINPQYSRMPTGAWARGASDGRIVIYKNGAFGIVDTRGKTLVGLDRGISNITDFQNGVATVTKSGQRYQIDIHGNRITDMPLDGHYQSSLQTVSPPASITISQTSSNILGASTGVMVAASTTSTPAVSQAVISTTKITPIQQTQTASPSVQTAVVTPRLQTVTTPKSPPFFPAQRDGKWGFIDGDGVEMIQYVFDEVQSYSEGLAAVRMGSRWGYIDGRGDLVIYFRFEHSGVVINGATPALPSTPFKFENGKAWIGNLQNGTKMCIDRQGDPAACQE